MQEKEAVQTYPHMAWPHNTSYRLEFKNGMSVEMDSEAVLKAWDRSNGARLNIKSDQDAFGRPFSFTAKMSDLAEVIDMDTGEMLYATPERADVRRLMAEKEQAMER